MEVEAACSGGAGESRWSQLGSSLPVRNVQALAASGPDELTADTIERYIQPDIDAHVVLAEHSSQVPVIDLRKLLNAETLEAEAAKLKFACQEWGFFQVVNHGVPDEVIANIKCNIHRFFDLPLDVKNAYAQRPGDLQGYGQAFIFSGDQKLDWADMFGIFTQPSQARDMSYWPSQPGTFRYKSIEHRVTINAHKERLSISAFQVPKYDGIVSPVPGSMEEEVLYKTMTVEEYARLYMSNKPDGKSNLDYAKLS
ncbi:hypothetical protein ACQ4PT_051014 [Festuca glaucescens]